jgi:hypothetical protein
MSQSSAILHAPHTLDDVLSSQRTDKGLAYDALMKGITKIRQSSQATHKDQWKALNDEMLAMKGVSAAAVHSNTFLSNMSVQYANDEYIGERLVGYVPVDKRSNVFAVYPKRERFEYPDDALGARTHANELDESRTSDNYSVKDFGFQNFVSNETLSNQDPIFDEMMDLVDAINEGIAFKRELRLASILTTAANFSGNTVTLAGADQWDSGAGGNPIKDIQVGKAALFMGRGQTDLMAYCSLQVFNVLSRHPHILDLLKYSREGIAQRTELANLFGFTDLLVGAARKQTANQGQTASFSRIWGLDFGMVRVARRATKRSAHFCSLFRMNGDPVTTEWYDPRVGKTGGNYAKVGVSEDAKIVAGDCGYIIKAATSA